MCQTNLYHPSQYPHGLIGPVDIIWHSESGRVWLRLHPSIYQEVWDAIAELRHQEIVVFDVRDELGSFELVGPESGKLLRRIFRTCKGEQKLALEDPRSLPYGTIMTSVVHDPRLK